MKLKPCPFCGGEVTLEEMETHPNGDPSRIQIL